MFNDNKLHPVNGKLLATFLVGLRKGAGLTQKEASVVLKVAQSTISRIESGKLVPNLSVAYKLKKYYKINAADMDEYLGISPELYKVYLLNKNTYDSLNTENETLKTKINRLEKKILRLES